MFDTQVLKFHTAKPRDQIFTPFKSDNSLAPPSVEPLYPGRPIRLATDASTAEGDGEFRTAANSWLRDPTPAEETSTAADLGSPTRHPSPPPNGRHPSSRHPSHTGPVPRAPARPSHQPHGLRFPTDRSKPIRHPLQNPQRP